eukprot:CAMPEP_0170550270 /NCGR_PEP_ID=MMETSP0211-20121228/8341_1 /TAXON_ID=311385 /ORGANISM="Pseudokeronopsis sp., Strain OXSARD2" /LENGTH=223 /DNA_ID=CAMNT_0010856723 /DNA_START=88 /DNA_END=759 /DNA_ORIENTATION=-
MVIELSQLDKRGVILKVGVGDVGVGVAVVEVDLSGAMVEVQGLLEGQSGHRVVPKHGPQVHSFNVVVEERDEIDVADPGLAVGVEVDLEAHPLLGHGSKDGLSGAEAVASDHNVGVRVLLLELDDVRLQHLSQREVGRVEALVHPAVLAAPHVVVDLLEVDIQDRVDQPRAPSEHTHDAVGLAVVSDGASGVQGGVIEDLQVLNPALFQAPKFQQLVPVGHVD